MKSVWVVFEIHQSIAIIDFQVHLKEHCESQHPGDLRPSVIADLAGIECHHIRGRLPECFHGMRGNVNVTNIRSSDEAVCDRNNRQNLGISGSPGF